MSGRWPNGGPNKGREHMHKDKRKSTADTVSVVETLAQLGITKKQSHRWQASERRAAAGTVAFGAVWGHHRNSFASVGRWWPGG
jgi:hypothetical protein